MMDYQCVVVYTIVSITTQEEDIARISQKNGCLGCITGMVKKLSIAAVRIHLLFLSFVGDRDRIVSFKKLYFFDLN